MPGCKTTFTARFPSSLHAAVVGLLLIGSGGLCFSPYDALRYQSEEVALQVRLVEILERKLEALRLGLSADLSADYNFKEFPAYVITLRYGPLPAQLLETERQVALARQELKRLRREAVQKALSIHARWWVAQSAEQAATIGLQIAQLRLDEAERRARLGATSQLEVEETRLAVLDAKNHMLYRQAELQGVQMEAADLGISTTLEPATISFQLPRSVPEESPPVLDAVWNLRLAHSQLEQARRVMLPTVALEGSYVGRDLSLQAIVQWKGLDMPQASIGIGRNATLMVDGLTGLKVGLSLRLSADQAFDIEQSQYLVDLAQVRLQRTLSEVGQKFNTLQNRAVLAFRALETARARYDLAKQNLLLAQERFNLGTLARLGLLEAQRQEKLAQERMASAWQNYVEAVAALLALVGEDWQVVT